MSERREFKTKYEDFEIFMHPDGSLTIEATGDYGDSEIGWGSTSSTLNLSPEQVVAFREFLAGH